MADLISGRFRRDAILIAAILALVFALLTVILGALYYVHKKQRVDLFEYGIRVITWRGATSFPWISITDLEVEPIFGKSSTPVNWDFRLTRDDGMKSQFRGLEDLERLGKIVERKVSGNL